MRLQFMFVYLGISTLISIGMFFVGYFIDRRYLLTQSEPVSIKQPQVILLVIDSFRADLAISHEFKFIRKMLKDHKKKSLLFVSEAHVPTVTGPRLQAMTSGNFPPLSKQLDNFHASEITEDNILFQLNKAKKKSFFTGDNTWAGLYPNSFTGSYFLETYDIGTQFTIDNYNYECLMSTINTDYDFIVAHFLGLDHTGHDHGVFNNTGLNSKLKQLSDMIFGIYDKMDKDSILLIAGDHGMANDGDHGGNSTEETNTIFFATKKRGHFKRTAARRIKNYSVRQNGLIPKKASIRTINQIDIVPTLSKLLGIAIPYSNLGIILPEIIPYNADCIDNMRQIITYINSVHNIQGKFTSDQVSNWNTKSQQLDQCKKILPFLKEIQLAARGIWSQYDFTLLNLSFVYSSILLVQYIVLIFQTFKFSKDMNDQSLNSHFYSALPIGLVIIMDWKYALAICLISNAILVLFQSIKFIHDNYIEQQGYHTTKANASFLSYLLYFSIIVFGLRILFQAMLLLSVENKRNEINYLFYVIIFFVLLLGLQKIVYQTLEQIHKYDYFKTSQSYVQAIIVTCLTTVTLCNLLYGEASFHEAVIQDNGIQQSRIIRLYFPCILLQYQLYTYVKKFNLKDKIYLHTMLTIVELFYIIENTEMELFTKIWLPRLVYILSLRYFYQRDLIYIFMICLMVSDTFGLAIYSVMFSILYIVRKQIIKHKYSPIVLVSIATLIASWTWFVLGNKCTITSVKVGRAFVGLKSFNVILSPLILTLYLVGPFVGVAMFLCKSSKNSTTKALFMLIYYIQVQFSQLHSYANAGGIIEIHFKYIFDAVTYIVILIIACGM